MKTTPKAYEVSTFKALPDQNGSRGRFTAIVSVFGNVDLQGDRVVKGAFQKDLERLQTVGDPLPIIWSHEWGDPHAHIGWAAPDEVRETDVGLEITGQLDLDHPFAAQVYKLLQQRRVKQWSFAYDIEDEKKATDGANELRQLRIIEAGPTLAGANPETDTITVKSSLEHAAKAGAKAGRALSAKNEGDLRQAHELLGRVLQSVTADDDEEKAADLDAAKAAVEAAAATQAAEAAEAATKAADADTAAAAAEAAKAAKADEHAGKAAGASPDDIRRRLETLTAGLEIG